MKVKIRVKCRTNTTRTKFEFILERLSGLRPCAPYIARPSESALITYDLPNVETKPTATLVGLHVQPEQYFLFAYAIWCYILIN
jgi:hypothetical protein